MVHRALRLLFGWRVVWMQCVAAAVAPASTPDAAAPAKCAVGGASGMPSACKDEKLLARVERTLLCVLACSRSRGKELKAFGHCLKPNDRSRSKCLKFMQTKSRELEEILDPCWKECQRHIADARHGKRQTGLEMKLPEELPPEMIVIASVQSNCTVESLSFDVSNGLVDAAFVRARELLQLCGVVNLRGLLPSVDVEAVRADASRFLADKDKFLSAYRPGNPKLEPDNVAAEAGLPFNPNLRGGRFEVVPAYDASIVKALELLGDGPISRLLASIWSAKPQLFVAHYMSQSPITWNQPQHSDANSIEDVKVQVALHDYTRHDGPTEFWLGSHLVSLPKLLLEIEPQTFPTMVLSTVNAGDALIYFSGVAHRGLENDAKKVQRLALDLVLNSVGRYAHDSERQHRPYVAENIETRKFREVWERR